MSSLLPKDDFFGYADDIAEFSRLAGEVSDLTELVPYIKAAVGAVRWYRTHRAIHFFRSLHHLVAPLPEETKKEFYSILNSKEGAKVLSEYTETVIRTGSATAIAALAILYADTKHSSYSLEFKTSAALALQGLPELEVDAFLDLASVEDFITRDNQPELPYPVAVANDELISSLPRTASALANDEVRVAVVRDLINRGLFLPDFASARLSDGGVGTTYGIGQSTIAFKELLAEAKNLLPDETTSPA
jgi:hypothetical protein